MATEINYSLLNNIDKRSKDIVFGYSRKVESTLPHSFRIPREVVLIILFYYFEQLRFNTAYSGDNIVFVNETTVKKTKGGKWSSCVFGSEIFIKSCNTFEIHIKWKHTGTMFYMGFITRSITKSIGNWNQRLGVGENKDYSVGIWVDKSYSSFYLRDKDNATGYIGKQLKYTSKTSFKQDDVFILLFDFVNNNFHVYHNNKDGVIHDVLSLNKYDIVSSIIPAFSLYGTGETLEIIKCIFK